MAETVNAKEFKYFFKTTKLTDETGAPIGEGRKHPDVVVSLPVPDTEQVIQLLAQEGPVRKMLMDAVEDVIFSAGRQQINSYLENNPDGTFTNEMFDLSKLTLEAIALIPKKERGAWAPGKEDLDAFCEDYKQVMVHDIGYDAKRVGTHCNNFSKGLIKIKNDKPILAKVKELLLTWAAKSPNIDEHQQTYDWFVARIEKWLKAEEKLTVEAF